MYRWDQCVIKKNAKSDYYFYWITKIGNQQTINTILCSQFISVKCEMVNKESKFKHPLWKPCCLAFSMSSAHPCLVKNSLSSHNCESFLVLFSFNLVIYIEKNTSHTLKKENKFLFLFQNSMHSISLKIYGLSLES